MSLTAPAAQPSVEPSPITIKAGQHIVSTDIDKSLATPWLETGIVIAFTSSALDGTEKVKAGIQGLLHIALPDNLSLSSVEKFKEHILHAWKKLLANISKENPGYHTGEFRIHANIPSDEVSEKDENNAWNVATQIRETLYDIIHSEEIIALIGPLVYFQNYKNCR